MSSKLRALFFDAGNTLMYPRVEVLAEDLTSEGFPASADDFFDAERYGKQRLDEWLWPQIRSGEVPRAIDHYYWDEYLRRLVEHVGVPEKERERVVLRVAEGFRDITLWSHILPDTPPLLDAFRARGYFMGVISNSIGTMEEQLGRLGLARRFDTILDSAVVGVEKPHPEIFELALDRAGVDAAEALFVGDTYSTDIGGAELVGLRGVLIDRVGAYPGATCPRVTSLAGLEQIVESLSRQ